MVIIVILCEWCAHKVTVRTILVAHVIKRVKYIQNIFKTSVVIQTSTDIKYFQTKMETYQDIFSGSNLSIGAKYSPFLLRHFTSLGNLLTSDSLTFPDRAALILTASFICISIESL